MPWFNPLKRGTDLLVTALAAPFLLAIGLVLAILIRLESKGPAIYRQRRVSAKGKAFTLLKFRSMRADAEVDGAQFTTENDPRITRLGHFMRKTRLDELPQFWNILKGDMSLVGPRPERPNFVEQYEREIPNYNLRQIARPGLTGWAQIETGYSSDTAGTIRKLERDLYYVKYRSIALDTYIIYRTIRTVFFGSGAR
jgi:lipopolysaccharide/colanic/teichoic acid biosynthesis glycosyltransferase